MDRDVLDEHHLRRLIDVGRGLVAQLDLEAVLREVVEVARELTGARYAALGILDEERRELERFVYVGIDEEIRARISDLPRGRGVLGELIRNPAPLRLREVGEHPRSFGFPAGHPPMHGFLGVPIVVHGQVYGNLYLTEKEEGDFDAADEETASILAEWAAVTIFNVRLYAQSEEERGALERAVHGLEATTEIARAVGGETDRARVLETIAKRARALAGAASLLVLLGNGGDHEVVAAAGECGVEPVGRRLTIEIGGPAEALSAVRGLGIEACAALIAPLSFHGKPLGAIVALDRLEEGPDFYAEDERLLVGAAASAAIAVATVQSVTEERLRQSLTAAERERVRWARELHDTILQGLGARHVLLSSALKGGEESRLAAAVEEALGEMARDIEELRGLITELRPATLDQLGLAAALEDLAERIGHAAGVELTTDLELDAERLDPELESVVYRLVQEALNNIAKHAGASRATVRIRCGEDRLELLVSDDGRGFDPDAEHSGFGLAGMRERVKLVGGDLQVESAPGARTRVIASVPLAAASGDPGAGADSSARSKEIPPK
ncbi:MAG TPA: GAF domain-containing sensor histidine kinase [Solirubrobacterales bacterium]|nr:GAF domain-containing sensor histidine kinase [Solirubrobacterales bacterium]